MVLADFGLAKTADNAGKSEGTVAWTAPEILNGESKATFKTDVYSLGMVFYEITARRNPFAEQQDETVIRAMVISGERPKVPAECPQVWV